MLDILNLNAIRYRRWWRKVKPQLGSCGENVHLPMSGSYSYRKLFLGSDIHIGFRSTFWATNSSIIIGDHVVMGPEVTIMGGDHNICLNGRFMSALTEKDKIPLNDQDVTLEGDIWVGARVIILKGVKIGRGAVIGAGAVVSRSVPPYCIAAGNPARPLRLRGNIDQVLDHEKHLYTPENRLARPLLESIVADNGIAL